MRLDLSYVDNWSMIGDMLIIAKTLVCSIPAQGRVLKGTPALASA